MPKEYQELLTRLLAIQADCEIGGPHIYVDHWTLRAPTVDDQWRVARIAAEEIDHCRKFLRMLQLIDIVGQYQLDEMVGSSFMPVDNYLDVILREEKGHIAYGQQKLEQLIPSG